MRSHTYCLNITLLVLLSFIPQVAFNQNFWQQTNGPDGGTIYSFAVSPPATVFAATAAGGVFRSTDGCETWSQVNNNLDITNAFAVHIAPDGSILLSAERVAGSTLYRGVYRSTNNGDSWFSSATGLAVGETYSFLNALGQVFAYGSGIYHSTNNGSTWTPIVSPPPCGILSMVSNSLGHLFAACSEEIYRSVDSGTTWQPLSGGTGFPWLQNLSINSAGHIFASAIGGGVLRSTDNGNSWTTVFYGLNMMSVFVAANGYVFCADSWTFTGAIRRSTNNGATWTVVLNLPVSGQFIIRTFASLPNGATIAAFSEDGIRLTTDNGSTWLRKNAGLKAISVQKLARHPAGFTFAGTFGAGVFRSSNGIDWEACNQGVQSPYVYSIAVQSSGTLFAGTGAGGLVRSTNLGNSWQTIRSDFYFASDAILVDETDAIFVGQYGRIFRSTDNGQTWVRRDSGMIQAGVQCFALSPTGNIFVGTSDGVLRTTDKGGFWMQLSSGWDVRSLTVNHLGHIFAALAWGGGFLRSTDNGNNWVPINNGITNFGQAIFFHPSGDLYASSLGGGAFRSTNNGDSWTQINSGFTTNGAFSFSLDDSGHLLAGTWGRAVFRSVQPTVSVPNEPQQIPLEVFLYQNFPNPFNPTTTITFSLLAPQHVSIKLFDLLGREVASLASGHFHAGVHNLTVDAKGLSSGVYLYQLQTGTTLLTRKLNVLK